MGGGGSGGPRASDAPATVRRDVAAIEAHAAATLRRAREGTSDAPAEPVPPLRLSAPGPPTPAVVPERPSPKPAGRERQRAERRASNGSPTALHIVSPSDSVTAGVDITIPLLALMMVAVASAATTRRHRGGGARRPR